MCALRHLSFRYPAPAPPSVCVAPVMIKKPSSLFSAVLWLAAAVAGPSAVTSAPSPAGETRIAKWKDDRKAAFMMMFDDCCPTHVTNVYPQLHRRGMTGTYYIVGNKPERKARLGFWDKEAPASSSTVYGNHTLNHRAFTDADDAEREISGCNELIHRLMPGKNPRLISYASPGGAKHATTMEELAAITAKHRLVLRPPFQGHGAGVHFHTGADVLRAVDKALAVGSAEYVIFHGVGGDWLSFDGAEFAVLLDGLEARRGDLWITDHVSVYKYETQLAAASVRVLGSDARQVRLALESSAAPDLHDQPLTLLTRVDALWKQCRVTQGGRVAVVPASAGVLRYEAVPGGGEVLIQPVR